MKRHILSFLFCFSVLTLGSCKDHPKGVDNSTNSSEAQDVKPKKKEITEEDKKINQSVVYKIMLTPELNMFSRTLVTSELIEFLGVNEGPYTIFAPSNKGFDALSTQGMEIHQRPDRKAELIEVIKSHVVPQKMDSATLVQELKGKDKIELKTLSGSILTVQRRDMDIIISDADGNEALLGKTDIMAENGVVHIIDKVLTLK